ncbi:hypothetical protein ES705_15246 [subsurface metagenome]
MSDYVHKIVYYLGPQETHIEDLFLCLCTCVHCGSTIAIPDRFVLDTTGRPFYNFS